ncbi:MAG: cyclic nucleotide-binding domain-containing protein [Elusimicrobia bacterium]|nr:cyclic nucleotide-binding domain-containing protein [Elusimicrobiota bacterium]
MSETEKLKNIYLFKDFTESQLSEISLAFKQSSIEKDEIIFREGDPGEVLFLISSGEVIIEKKMDDECREFKQLAILSRGEFFGEMAMLESQPRFAQARAGRNTELYEINRPDFFNFIKEHPENGLAVFSKIMKVVSKRLQHTSSELTMLFDISKLLMMEHKSAGDFLARLVREIFPYFEGKWNINAYFYDKFNDEFTLSASKETFSQDASMKHVRKDLKSGWLGGSTYQMLFSSEKGGSLGCVIFSCSDPPSELDKNNYATIFWTISSILSSAIENIEHRTEIILMEKLKTQKHLI